MGLSGVDIPFEGQVFLENTNRWPWTPPTPISASSGTYVTRTEFTLPVDARSHFFFARGAHNHGGAFRIKVANPVHGLDPNTVRGTVLTHYRTSESWNRVKMCTLTKDDGSYGLGVFVSRSLCPEAIFLQLIRTLQTASSWPNKLEDFVGFEITILVPPPGEIRLPQCDQAFSTSQ